VGELLDSGQFILSKPVRDFEEAFAEFVGSEYAVGLNSGSDALYVALRALNIGPGDEVLCPAFAPISAVEPILRVGATPVLIDVGATTYTVDPEKVEAAASDKTKALIAPHLFGRACDMERLLAIAAEKQFKVIEDCTHAAGAMCGEEFCGSLGLAGCFSFSPTLNLGAIGDGGMLVTNDETLAQEAMMLRDHGRSSLSGECERIGFNSRLDAVQAVYLDMRIEDLEESNVDRLENARLYDKLFEGSEIVTPEFVDDGSHVYCYYTIQTRDRDRLRNFLGEKEIGSEICFPRGLHREPAIERLCQTRGPAPVTDILTRRVLSLPCYPSMKRAHVEEVAGVVLEFLERNESFERRRR
jgi:dTDP-4-amino-4,6-dideoxygalactose transaminase